MRVNKIVVVVIGIIGFAVSCGVNKEMQYVFPAMMPEPVKTENLARCKTGYELYKAHCSKCHSTYKGKREIIPKFSTEQISTYQFRTANLRHTDSLKEEHVSDENLTYIITFLTYQVSGEKVKRVKR